MDLKLRNGIAGHDTIRRVFEAISPQELETRFVAWAEQMCGTPVARIIAIDGKSLRGSGSVTRGTRPIHMVSAYAAEYGLTLGQRTCQEKSNEITAIKELLPTLKLEGSVVTIDAIGCQTTIAQPIIDGKGDYVLAVKENQPTLAEAIRQFKKEEKSASAQRQWNGRHGKVDNCQVGVFGAIARGDIAALVDVRLHFAPYFLALLRRVNAAPSNPKPMSAMDPGSGIELPSKFPVPVAKKRLFGCPGKVGKVEKEEVNARSAPSSCSLVFRC